MTSDIHPTAVLGPEVTLGDDVVVGPFAVLAGRTSIGSGVWIGPHTVLGTPAEIRGHHHGTPWSEVGGGALRIGDRSTLREHVTVHAGSVRETVVGPDCFLLDKSYVAHDCVLGARVTLSPSASLAGHVTLGDDVTVGMGALVHQRRAVGPGAMVGMGAVVTHDVAPYVTAYGTPARVRGANLVGMQRLGIPPEDVAWLTERHRTGQAFPTSGTGLDAVPPSLRPAAAWWERATGAGPGADCAASGARS